MNEIEKAFEAGFQAYREAFDHYDDLDATVEHSLKWRMAEYVAAQPGAQCACCGGDGPLLFCEECFTAH